MPAPEILVLRHGETVWNREGRFQGARDSELTRRGRDQAAALGLLLRELGAGPATHRARVSPQGRAVATAALALGPWGTAARPDPRLREIGMGAWTGLARAEVDRRWPPREGEGVLGFYARCPGGEGLAAVAARVDSLLAELDGPAVLVTHGLTLRVLCARAAGRPLADAEAVAVPQGALARVRDGGVEILAPRLPGGGAAGRTAAAGG